MYTMTLFAEKYQIIPVAKAIARFQELYPEAILTKLQLEYEGPFLKYDLEGMDASTKYTIDLNAQTGETLKSSDRPLKEKEVARRDSYALNINNLLPLEEITQTALDAVPVDHPIQWELDRKRERTYWKVEVVNQQGGELYEAKVDAQEGTLLEMKLKH